MCFVFVMYLKSGEYLRIATVYWENHTLNEWTGGTSWLKSHSCYGYEPSPCGVCPPKMGKEKELQLGNLLKGSGQKMSSSVAVTVLIPPSFPAQNFSSVQTPVVLLRVYKTNV